MNKLLLILLDNIGRGIFVVTMLYLLGYTVQAKASEYQEVAQCVLENASERDREIFINHFEAIRVTPEGSEAITQQMSVAMAPRVRTLIKTCSDSSYTSTELKCIWIWFRVTFGYMYIYTHYGKYNADIYLLPELERAQNFERTTGNFDILHIF